MLLVWSDGNRDASVNEFKENKQLAEGVAVFHAIDFDRVPQRLTMD